MTKLALSDTLDREATRLLAVELRDAIDRGQPVSLIARAVEKIGTAGLQLLISARRSTVAGDADVRLVDPSPALLRTAELAGVADVLGLSGEARDDV